MKLKSLIFVLIFISKFIEAQTWCPAGAVWHCQYDDNWSTGYHKIEYAGDTVISGFSCRKMTNTFYTYNYVFPSYDTIQLETEYTYSDTNKVYIYRFNNFYTLYDFSAHVGDIWEVAGKNAFSFAACDSVGFVKVDSVGTMIINGHLLRYVCVSPLLSSSWGWNAKIVEKVGPIVNYQTPSYTLSYLFPFKQDNCGLNLDQSNEGGAFRCYFDTAFGSYFTANVIDCEFLDTEIQENTSLSNRFNIAPNPVFSESTIDYALMDEFQGANFFIYDAFGRVAKTIPIEHKNGLLKLESNDFKNGIYLIVMKVDERIIQIKRMIVSN